MGAFVDHLLQDGTTYPYLTPEEFLLKCSSVSTLDPEDDDIIDTVLTASLIVYYLTGRQFEGTTQATLRPDCVHDACAPRSINLGVWPITDIVSVRYGGEDHDPAEFHIDEWKFLARNDGEAFPRCGNWHASSEGAYDSSDDPHGFVFETVVEYGLTPPRLIKRATAALACNLWLDNHEEDCNLPSGVTSMSRQGVSLEISDYMEALNLGRTGIYPLDLAIQVFNPSKLQSPSFVWTPDMDRARRGYT